MPALPPTILIPALPDLTARYTHPSRHYHNLQHIHTCLDLFTPLKSHFADPDAVEIAIWFHDAIYDATRTDNEEQSAALAVEFLTAASTPNHTTSRVASLILATKHKSPPTDFDEQLLTDIDLAILAAPPAEFDAYERAIRLEYNHLPDSIFLPGRAAFLRTLLARPALYSSPELAPRFEGPARANLARSLAMLD